MNDGTLINRPITGGPAHEFEDQHHLAFLQTYSMADIINSTTRLSKKWKDFRCRVWS